MTHYHDSFEKDAFTTSGGQLEITFIGRSALIFQFQEKILHVDPIMQEADYRQLPKADLILITHEHHDHFDLNAIEAIKKSSTEIVCPKICAEKLEDYRIINNNENIELKSFFIESVPAYNIVHMRDGNTPFHPKGNGNGYIITFANTRVYVAGDTENIPEIKKIKNIDIAFLPMNVPVTMSPEMVYDVIISIKPKIFYPYHYGDTAMKWGETDPNTIVEMLKDLNEVDVRIRNMK